MARKYDPNAIRRRGLEVRVRLVPEDHNVLAVFADKIKATPPEALRWLVKAAGEALEDQEVERDHED